MAEKRKDDKGRILKSGEFQREEDGRYCFEYTDLRKKRRRVYASSLVELREKERTIMRDLEDGIRTQDGDLTLNELFEIYMQSKNDLRDSTRSSYLRMWEYRVKDSELANMKIGKIKQLHIKTFYSRLVKEGLSESTIKYIHNMISPALELAVDSDLIRKNPAHGARKGVGGTKKKKEALSREQQNNLIEFLSEEYNIYSVYKPMIELDLATALRVGELTGLRWKDVDLKNGILHIRQQLIYKNYGDGCKFHIQKLKTDAGLRDIPITESIHTILEEQLEYSKLLGVMTSKFEVDGISDFVFKNKNGRPYATNAFNFILENIVDAFNRREEEEALSEGREEKLIPHISAHILRHTACTRLAESGLDPKVLQYIMGHTNVTITMDVYTHITEFDRVMKQFQKAQNELDKIE